MARDDDRLREFHDERAGLTGAQSQIDSIRQQLKSLKEKVPVQCYGDIDQMHRRLGEMKTDLNNMEPGMKMKEGGAKHQLKALQGHTSKYSAGIEEGD